MDAAAEMFLGCCIGLATAAASSGFPPQWLLCPAGSAPLPVVATQPWAAGSPAVLKSRRLMRGDLASAPKDFGLRRVTLNRSR